MCSVIMQGVSVDSYTAFSVWCVQIWPAFDTELSFYSIVGVQGGYNMVTHQVTALVA